MPPAPVVAGDRWRVHQQPDGGTLYAVHGPAPVDTATLARWLDRSCQARVPVRQGFTAVLVRADLSVVAASSNRMEVTSYWAFEHGRPVIGVHLSELVRGLDRPPALDLDKLADLMVLHDDPETTVFEGVHRLPIGHRLTWSPGGQPRVDRWFRPLDEEPLRISVDEAPAHMRETVRDAVAASLPASGDVAGTLSGGLDSSMVLGTAAGLLHPEGRTVHALTSVPLPGAVERRDGWVVSDGPDAERMCREVPGMTWTGVANEAHTLSLDILDSTFQSTWHPIRNPSNMVWIVDLVRRAEALGVPLLLTGATGNGPFSRDRPGVVRTLLRQRRFGPLLREPRRRRAAGAPWSRIARNLAGEAGLRPPRRTAPSPFVAAMPVLADRMDERRRALLTRFDRRRDPQESWMGLVTRDASQGLVGQELSADVWWSDPLCDPEVVTLALRLPPESWLYGGTPRGLAREASRGVVPDHIRLRHTRGAQAADVGLVLPGRQQSYRDAVDVLRASPAAASFIDLDALAHAVEHGFPAEGEDARTWQVAQDRAFGYGLFAAWYERHIASS
jgi:asparagine synthase (glutamine-hydrolysing)